MIIEDAYHIIIARANAQMKQGDISGYLKSLIQLQYFRSKLSLLNTRKG